MDFQALVCGASKGIGRAIACELAARGYRILAVARDQADLELLLRELPLPDRHQCLALDLTDHQRLSRMLGTLDLKSTTVLINNLAGPKSGPLAEASAQDLVVSFHAHIVTAQVLLQCLLPAMKKHRFGRVINVISTSVKAPIPNLGVSNTVRGAMANWAKTLALELASFGVTVNNVLPGYTKTERLEVLKNAAADRLGQTPQEVETQWLSSIPARRFAEPWEIAKAVAFLASRDADYINGINLPVDGGRTPSL